MKVRTLADLKKIKEDDLKRKRLTYIVPKSNLKNGFVRDELMWVKKVNDHSFVIFRCMDGKNYKFSQEDLSYLLLVGREK